MGFELKSPGKKGEGGAGEGRFPGKLLCFGRKDAGITELSIFHFGLIANVLPGTGSAFLLP